MYRDKKDTAEKGQLTADDFQAHIPELTANLENTVESYQSNEGEVNYDLVTLRVVPFTPAE